MRERKKFRHFRVGGGLREVLPLSAAQVEAALDMLCREARQQAVRYLWRSQWPRSWRRWVQRSTSGSVPSARTMMLLRLRWRLFRMCRRARGIEGEAVGDQWGQTALIFQQ
jgi:hypothetical protein